MIRSFATRETHALFRGKRVRQFPPDIHDTARRKLRQLEAAERLDDMRQPPGNRLEQLKGYAPPRYSVRINDQWRLTFCWSDGGADDVRIEDYHRG
ncbi:type II toxin-antitoxin system RelE/ParE family toxin [uncultured Sphingomonas sp.]|uniref:type II toxin-antitoxin system RelE/ParE family toxin n=2 Tax=Sphingomonadaceae TaxID=41297 RepID=UPI002596BBD9|nr:type II toxin-antitoxin system RelE/ParE family toxin [uncultured Sphingomonas sp.]